MNKDLIEQLLFEEESTTLDFKRGQYKFVNATDREKSELLKDIIAFANSWRRSTAYILLGIEESKGEKSKITGVATHLDDANLQEFVNKKLNKPISFSYQAAEFSNTQIAIIEIPVQERPFYLKKDYGKLKKEKIYIRRGTSTDIASLEEVSKMGGNISSSSSPNLSIQLSDVETHQILDIPITIESTFHKISNEDYLSIPDYSAGHSYIDVYDKDYYRDFFEYFREKHFFKKFGFSVVNKGDFSAKNAILKISYPADEGVFFKKEILDPPDSSMIGKIRPIQEAFQETIISCSKVGSRWKIEIKLSDIRPKDTTWSHELYIASNISQNILLDVSIYADNLINPVLSSFEINFDVEDKDLTVDQIITQADYLYKS